MPDFNLINDPWIPVRWQSGVADESPLVSLHEAFSRARKIADLDCAPHERIALTRLLVCITHAALGAPEDDGDWERFGGELESAVGDYLARPDILPHFNLFGDGPRFLQLNRTAAEKVKPQPISKAFFELSSGNGPTLLDHWGESQRPWTPARVALGILCLQNFFVGGSMGPAVKGNGPALKSLQMLIRGASLREIILNNCVDADAISQTGGEVGRPVWETGPDQNLLSRLAPATCSLLITDDLAFVHVASCFEYLEYDAYREPGVTTIVSNDEKRRLLRARPSQGIWRDLHLLTNLSKAKGSSAPLTLQSFSGRRPNEVDLWVGELIKHEKLAKILDATESSFSVPRTLLGLAGHRLYASGIDHTNLVGSTLGKAVWAYWQNVTNPDKRGKVPGREQAEKHFWHRLDQTHRTLINMAASPKQGAPPIGSAEADDPWTKTVRNAALDAYAAACPRTTPRQIEAYAAGMRPLRKVLSPKPKKAAEPA